MSPTDPESTRKTVTLIYPRSSLIYPDSYSFGNYSSTPAYLLTSSIIHVSVPAHVLHHPHQRTCSCPPSSTPVYLLTSSIIHTSIPAHVLHHPCQHTCSRLPSSTPAYLLTSSIIHTSIPAHILHHPHQHTCSRPPSSMSAYLLTPIHPSLIHLLSLHLLPPSIQPLPTCSSPSIQPLPSLRLSLPDPSILSGSTDPFILTPSPSIQPLPSLYLTHLFSQAPLIHSSSPPLPSIQHLLPTLPTMYRLCAYL
jgi:hypothetical protein